MKLFIKILFCLFVVALVKSGMATRNVRTRNYTPTYNGEYETKITSFSEWFQKYRREPTESECIQIIENGADPNEHIILPEDLFSQQAALFRKMNNVMSLKSVQPYTMETGYLTPLFFAISLKYNDLIYRLLKEGANPNEKMHYFYAGHLQQAIMSQDIEIVKALLSAGADVNLKSVMGNSVTAAVVSWKSKQTHIDKALNSGEEHVVSNLISTSKILLEEDVGDKTSYEILDLILKNGGDVKSVNENGFNPIMSALIARNYRAFMMMLPYVSAEEIDDMNVYYEGKSIPLVCMIVASGYREIVEATFKKGVKLNLSNGLSLYDYSYSIEIDNLISKYME